MGCAESWGIRGGNSVSITFWSTVFQEDHTVSLYLDKVEPPCHNLSGAEGPLWVDRCCSYFGSVHRGYYSSTGILVSPILTDANLVKENRVTAIRKAVLKGPP